jgi:hypothetical protein
MKSESTSISSNASNALFVNYAFDAFEAACKSADLIGTGWCCIFHGDRMGSH